MREPIVYVRDITPNRATVCARATAEGTLNSDVADLQRLATDPEAMHMRIWIHNNTGRSVDLLYPKRSGLL